MWRCACTAQLARIILIENSRLHEVIVTSLLAADENHYEELSESSHNNSPGTVYSSKRSTFQEMTASRASHIKKKAMRAHAHCYACMRRRDRACARVRACARWPQLHAHALPNSRTRLADRSVDAN
eukprot:4969267-Pleurochrysis_carterae.AAC.2